MLQDHLYISCFNSRISHFHWRKLFRNHVLSATCAYCYWVVFFLGPLSREMKKYIIYGKINMSSYWNLQPYTGQNWEQIFVYGSWMTDDDHNGRYTATVSAYMNDTYSHYTHRFTDVKDTLQ